MISCFTPESLLRGTWFAGLNTAVLPTRHDLRYPSDLSDHEWAPSELATPPAKRGGRWREVNVLDEVLNAMFYVLLTGCKRQALTKDLPPKSIAHSYLILWD
jgi:hypothetical protein